MIASAAFALRPPTQPPLAWVSPALAAPQALPGVQEAVASPPAGAAPLPAACAGAAPPKATASLRLARQVFGAAAQRPMPLVPMLTALRAAGHARLAQRLLKRVSPGLREALFAGKVSPAAWLAQAAAGRLGRAQAQAPDVDRDVLVLGAGAAGLAAAGALQRQGHRVLVLEAGPRPGGRARTDTEHFATCVDLGAQRLHSGACNPLVPVFRDLGFTLVLDSAPPQASDGSPGEDRLAHAQALQAARARLERLIEDHPHPDCAVASIPLPRQSPWDDTALTQIGALEAGVDLPNLSLAEHRSILPESSGDYYVAEGLGTAVAMLAIGIPLRLNSAVTQVSWGSHGVQVQAGGMAYRARSLVVTASTGQLARGDVHFVPPLPPAKLRALEHLPMGHYEKIVLEFSRNIFGQVAPGTRMQLQCSLDDPFDFCLQPPYAARPGAEPAHRVVVAYAGGAFAAVLQGRGEAAAIAYALERLRGVYGRAVDAAFVGGCMTHWGAEHGGAYSAARPGGATARSVLRQPLAQVVFFAGEACDAPLASGASWVTHVAGAYRSGLDAAAQVSAALAQPVGAVVS